MLNHNLDISTGDIAILRRCAMTLHRWCEHECNGTIQRDETTQKPFNVWFDSNWKEHRSPASDREAGALRRIEKVCKEYNAHYYYQTDPRGCALYVSMEPLTDQNYNSKGFAVGDYY